MMLASRHVADAPVGELAVIRDLACPGPAARSRCGSTTRARRASPGRCFLFFHGGGFVLGDLDTHEPFCAEMARQLDMPVLAVDYRLAPEHPWPAGVEDAIAAARWAAGQPGGARPRGRPASSPAGDSAGGNFAIVAALALRDEPAAVPVLAQWPIYPAADPGKGYPSYDGFRRGLSADPRRAWTGSSECYCADAKDWRYSPLVKSQAGMPPTLVVTASLDPIRDQGRAYAAACVEAGVPTIFREAKGNIHGFINLRKAIPSSAEDIRGCVAALKLLLAGGRGDDRQGSLPYRPAVGVMLLNREGKVLGRPAAR